MHKENALSSYSKHDKGALPPQDLNIEQAVLGAMLLEANSLHSLASLVYPELFYKQSHEYICEAILTLYNKHEKVDILTVTAELRKADRIEIVGGPYTITTLTDRVSSSLHLEDHVRILKQLWIKRRLISECQEIVKKGYYDSSDGNQLLSILERTVVDIGNRTNEKKKSTKITELVGEILHDIANQDPDNPKDYIHSGLPSLDRIINGFFKGELTVIYGRPGMGKTALLTNLTESFAVEFQVPTLVVSLEMQGKKLVTRIMSKASNVSQDKFRSNTINPNELNHIIHKTASVAKAEIYVEDESHMTIEDLRRLVMLYVMKYGIGVLLLDYLQLLTSEVFFKQNTLLIKHISNELKRIAKDFNIPVIAFSQLSRKVEERRAQGYKPMLSDLREGGDIEQAADLGIGMWRPEYYNFTKFEGTPFRTGHLELLIQKHRNGGLGVAQVQFVGETQTIQEFPIEVPITKQIELYDDESNNPISEPGDDDDGMPF